MAAFLDIVEARRQQASASLDPVVQSLRGQFFTPVDVARHMASLLEGGPDSITLLDAGAGVGILFAAAVEALCRHMHPPKRIEIVACEVDKTLASLAELTLQECCDYADSCGVMCSGRVVCADFLSFAERILVPNLLEGTASAGFQPQVVVMNPPYQKIGMNSSERHTLRRMGIETTNLYAGFVAAAQRLIAPAGELVAITPRSFCNGSYFRPFRQDLLQRSALTHLHVFKSRADTFRESAVLQETLIFRLISGEKQPEWVSVAHLENVKEVVPTSLVPSTTVLPPNDPEHYFHIPEDIVDTALPFAATLGDIGLKVSTGRVVDFRAEAFLRQQPDRTTAPLIYPVHCYADQVCWPSASGKKPNALVATEGTRTLRVPNGNYVLVKRFSTKEQTRRVMAAVYEGERFPIADRFGVGFENHLNYFHENGYGMDIALAKGLATYLNSIEVDTYFRQFSGHTQVNATDLKNLRYPSREELRVLGTKAYIGMGLCNE